MNNKNKSKLTRTDKWAIFFWVILVVGIFLFVPRGDVTLFYDGISTFLIIFTMLFYPFGYLAFKAGIIFQSKNTIEEIKNKMEGERIQGDCANYWINKNNKVMMSGYPEPVDITNDIHIIIDLGLQRDKIIEELKNE